MSRSYTPGLKILKRTKVVITRLLPMKGSVHYNVGDIVKSDDIIASTELPGNVQMMNIANKLNVEPENVPECMLVKLDEKIKEGQIIAESKGIFGLFKSQVTSPINGTLANVSAITGQAILAEPPIPVAVDAYISGKIMDVIEKEGVMIETEGLMVQGILGVGGENRGSIVVVTTSPDQELSKDMISLDYKGKIIIGGSFINFDAFERAKEIGVAGIITGGCDYEDLSKILGHSLGVAITGSEKIGPSLIITEGFGRIAMAGKTYSLLKENENKFASLNGTTQIRAGVIRPEILVSKEIKDTKDGEAVELDMAISERSPVRVIRSPFFGKVGVVKSLPAELVKMESETMVRIAEIEFSDGTIEIIPRANLEMILV
tara:strand:+ start:342 stop:1466 length:1125 start_codon:yes stop_codon:yes gene_type:complete